MDRLRLHWRREPLGGNQAGPSQENPLGWASVARAETCVSRSQRSVTPSPPSPEESSISQHLRNSHAHKGKLFGQVLRPRYHVGICTWLYALPCSHVYIFPSLHIFTYVHMCTLPLSLTRNLSPPGDGKSDGQKSG